MKIFFALLLWAPTVWAAAGTVVFFERSDAAGTSATAVHLAQGGTSWRTSKVAQFGVSGSDNFAFSPNPTPAQGIVFRSRGGAVPETQVYQVHSGAIPRNVRMMGTYFFSVMAVFSDKEVIAWEDANDRLWILDEHNHRAVTPAYFLGTTPVQDVSIARVDQDVVAIVARESSVAPTPGLPAEYKMFRFRLGPNQKVTLLSETVVPKKMPYTIVAFSAAGAFYVSSDAPNQWRLRHAVAPQQTDRNAALAGFSVAAPATLAPLFHKFGSQGHPSLLYVQAGNALIEFPFTAVSQAPRVLDAMLFSPAALGPTTALNGSKGVFSHRAIATTPPADYFRTISYDDATSSGTVAGAAAPSVSERLEESFATLWNDVYGRPVPAQIATADLVVVLERHAMKSEWLDKLLKLVPPTELLAFHLEKRGYPWFEVGTKTQFSYAALVARLAAIPDCAALLAPE